MKVVEVTVGSEPSYEPYLLIRDSLSLELPSILENERISIYDLINKESVQAGPPILILDELVF